MNKMIVLHDKYDNNPIVIRTSSIDAIRKIVDQIPDITDKCTEEYSMIMIGDGSIAVKETIGIVISKINKVEEVWEGWEGV